MCMFELLLQIQISLAIGNLHLADKVTLINNKTKTKSKTKNFNNTSLHIEVKCIYIPYYIRRSVIYC